MSVDDEKSDESIGFILNKLKTKVSLVRNRNNFVYNRLNNELNKIINETQNLIKESKNERNCIIEELDLLDVYCQQIDQVLNKRKAGSKISSIFNTTDNDDTDNLKKDTDKTPSKFTVFVPDTYQETQIPFVDQICNDVKKVDNNKIEIDNKVKVIQNTLEPEDLYVTECNVENKLNDIMRDFQLKKTNAQSTPRAVKQVLHEHGLHDLTNSPALSTLSTPFKSPAAAKHSNLNVENRIKEEKKHRDEIDVEVKERNKRYKMDFDSDFEVIDKKENILKKQTPQKQQQQQQQQQNVEEEESDPFNFSDDFKLVPKQIKTKSNQNKGIANPLYEINNQQMKQKNDATKRTSVNKPLSMRIQDSPSPFKRTNDSKSPKPRLKQITMTQAFENIRVSQLNISKDETKPTNAIPNKARKNVFVDENYVEDANSNDDTVFFDDDLTNDDMAKNVVKKEPNLKEATYHTKKPSSSTSNDINLDDDDDDLIFDFDKVPKKQTDSPAYKHQQVVRKQNERKKLPTSVCRQCELYWKTVPEDMRPKHMEESCRHREKYAAPPTPEHYWSLAFPNTQECIERGYGGVIREEDNNGPRRARRKRPLKLIEKKGDFEDD